MASKIVEKALFLIFGLSFLATLVPLIFNPMNQLIKDQEKKRDFDAMVFQIEEGISRVTQTKENFTTSLRIPNSTMIYLKNQNELHLTTNISGVIVEATVESREKIMHLMYHDDHGDCLLYVRSCDSFSIFITISTNSVSYKEKTN
jgi:hypothetical protein